MRIKNLGNFFQIIESLIEVGRLSHIRISHCDKIPHPVLPVQHLLNDFHENRRVLALVDAKVKEQSIQPANGHCQTKNEIDFKHFRVLRLHRLDTSI